LTDFIDGVRDTRRDCFAHLGLAFAVRIVEQQGQDSSRRARAFHTESLYSSGPIMNIFSSHYL
jgi:hypothetical protein